LSIDFQAILNDHSINKYYDNLNTQAFIFVAQVIAELIKYSKVISIYYQQAQLKKKDLNWRHCFENYPFLSSFYYY